MPEVAQPVRPASTKLETVQAMKFGTQFAVPRRVTALSKDDAGVFCAVMDDEAEVCARAVVVVVHVCSL